TVSRINYLKGKVSYSTIDLEFYQTINEQIASIETDSVVDNFKKALSAGWEGVVWFLIAITYIWPLIVSGIVAGALYCSRESEYWHTATLVKKIIFLNNIFACK